MPNPIIARRILSGRRSSLLDGLVAYWKLEEASGTRVDATGRGNDLTDNNSVGQAAGKVGNAASFVAASSQYLSRASTADLSVGTSSVTLAGWMKFTTVASVRTLLGKYELNQQEYTLDYSESVGTFRFLVSNNGSANTVLTSSFGAASAGAWYFVCVWRDATAQTINLQINGGAIASVSYTSPSIYSGTAGFGIGGLTYPGNYQDGQIDEVGIWKRVLTAAERTALYNGGAGRSHPFAGSPV